MSNTSAPACDPHLSTVDPNRCAALLLDWLIEVSAGQTLTFQQVRDRAADMSLWHQLAMPSEALLMKELALLLPGKHYESRSGRKVRVYHIAGGVFGASGTDAMPEADAGAYREAA